MKDLFKHSWGSIIVIVLMLVTIFGIEYKYSKYPNEVEAYLVSTYNPNDEKVIVGYIHGHGPHHGNEVYDRPYSPYKYHTYEYVVNGEVYTYTETSIMSARPTIKLRYADDPSIVIEDKRN